MVSWISLGPHRYYRDGDVLFTEGHGDFSREALLSIWDVALLIEKEHGYVFTVFDARQGLHMPPETRQAVAQQRRQRPMVSANFVIGASLALRTLVGLVQQAGRLLKIRHQVPTFFCATPDELQGILEAQRPIYRAMAAAAAKKK